MGWSMYPLVLMLVCVAFFHKAAELEGKPRFVAPALSLLLWLSAAYFLKWGIVGCIMTQVGLFVAMTIWNVATDDLRVARRTEDEESSEPEGPEDR